MDYLYPTFCSYFYRTLQIVLNVILGIFSFDHILLEIRGSLIVKKLHPPTYIQMVEALPKNNITCAAGRGTV